MTKPLSGKCDHCRAWVEVYWNPEHDNFYCTRCKRGMGEKFYSANRQATVKTGEKVRYVYLVRDHNDLFFIVPEPVTPGRLGARRYTQVGRPQDAHWFTDRAVAEGWAAALRGSVRTYVATRDGIVSGKGEP